MAAKIKSQTIFANYYTLAGINAKELEEKSFRESCILYDENGNVTERAKYSPQGESESMVKMKYDARGNKTEELHFISEDEISEKKTFKYDEKNMLAAEYLHYLDGSFDTTIYVYDKKNTLLETRTADSENQLELRKEYRYNNELLSEIISFDADENIIGKEIYKHDDKGNILEKTMIYEDGREENIFYEYDDLKRKTKIIQQNDIEKAETHFNYNDRGNVCEEKLWSGEKLLRRVVFTYDENSLPAGQTGLLKEIQEYTAVAGITSEQKTFKRVEYEYYAE